MTKVNTYAAATTEELKAKLKGIKRIHGAIVAVFVVILAAWLLFGYWRENLPIFISNVTMATAITAALVASRAGLVAELKRREQSGPETNAEE